MDSLWNTADAARCTNDLALRAYSSRLLGSDPDLVLHGGGNTSIKLDEHGKRVLHVKGTGSDLATVDARAFTPLDLDAVLRVLTEDSLDNAHMMRALDACLARRPAPRPSIETLLHAGLPFRCVEHTHADAVLAAMNVEDIDAVHAGVYGDVAPLVPYRHSGHALARACMEAFHAQRTPRTIGLVLAYHGVVAFGDDCRSSYENMIALVSRAENYLKAHGAWDISTEAPPATTPPDGAFDKLREDIHAAAGAPLEMTMRNDAGSLAFARRADLARISQQGPATPQHAVYTRRVPLLGRDVHAYAARYRAELDAHLGPRASALMDAAPRVVLDPEFGVLAFGKDARAARMAMEMFQHDMAIIGRASAHGRYRSAPPQAIAMAEFEYGGHAAKLAESD
jgi:rhamnose utilization protein RhaD (predicted bifunctional aldolase and dehydrogenase)